jgi:aspartate carbamoyltransferase
MKKRDLLTLKQLPVEDIISILDDADAFKNGKTYDALAGKFVANLFFEPSTRTQYSFNVAEEKLGMRVISFNPEASSLKKAESFYDTVKVFDAFNMDAVVIRHPENEYYNQLLGHINSAVINGGDGTGNHPTQSLLDLLTIRQEFGYFNGLKVAIVGDVVHSRVAHTNFEVMQRLGVNVCTSGPEEFIEEGMNFIPFEEALTTADVLMLLRVQHERHGEHGMQITKEEYHEKYGLSDENAKRMKPNTIIMHPAPFNRGVEISSNMVESAQSRIFKQMENGVYTRMAVLKWALGGE